ncbi:MAG TPA: hypothetical protein VD931_13335 [Baekduia sp.]|nr:hypothetical protein [Baekduia sp.]
MRTTPRQDTGNVNYVYDMVSRGLSKLLADPSVKGLNDATAGQVLTGKDGQWDLPDDTPVAVFGKERDPKTGKVKPKRWTWADVKARVNISPTELRIRQIVSNSIEAAQEAESAAKIEGEIMPFLDERIDVLEADLAELKAFAKRKDVSAKDLKSANSDIRRISGWLDRIRGAKERVLEELDRREIEGDAPRSDVRGMVSTEEVFGVHGLAQDNPKKFGHRVVEGDTGVPLRGTPDRGPGGELDTGMRAEDKQHGKAEVSKARITDAEYSAERARNAAVAAERKGRNLATPSKAGVYKGSLTRTGRGLGEPHTDALDPKTGKAVRPRPPRSDTVKVDVVPGDVREARKREAAEAKPAPTEEPGQVLSIELEGDFRKWLVKNPGGDPVKFLIEATQYTGGDRKLKALAVRAGKELRRLQGHKFSTMNVGRDGPLTKEEADAVRAYVEKVLGPDAKVLFKKMEAAGSFAKMNGAEVLKVAVDAMDPMGIARHEAAHALIARLLKADKKAAQTLLAAAGSPTVVSRLRTLLKGHPRALAQLSDPEERLAYMYQFWAAKQLTVGPNTETQFGKVRAFFRKVAGFWSEAANDMMNVEQAEAIFSLFDRGDLANPNTVREVLMDKLPKTAFERATELAGPIYKFLDKAISTADGYVRSMNVQAFNEAMDLFYSPTGSERAPGYIQTRYVELNKRLNVLDRLMAGASNEEQRLALEALQVNGVPSSERSKQIVEGVRALLKETFDYMSKSGVKAVVWDDQQGEYVEEELGFVPDYFPRYFDRQHIANTRAEFEAALVKAKNSPDFAKKVADSILRSSKQAPDENDFSAGLTFYAPNTMARKLHVDTAVLAPWLAKDLYGSMVSYLTYATRRAEYARRFGNQGQRIEAAIMEAKQQGASSEQIKNFSQAVMALEGSLGHDIKPELKQVMGGVLTYQNFRLLPLALFSSLVDPTGIIVRGGTVGDAFGAFVRSVKALVRETKDDRAFKLAELVGAISTNNEAHMLADAYGTQYMTEWQRSMNAKFFKLNGMERWNRSMRVAATGAAERFIIRHATEPNEHSERFLRELGITKDDVKVTDGELDVSSDKMQKAITQWVDGAVLRPNAAIRPIWMSDPHWMLIAHLKQFTYSFQKTIISRVVHEMENGNVSPALALVSYVPLIIGADTLRALLTPGGGDDEALERLGLGGIVWRGVQRAGIFGPGQYALDAYGDLGHGKLPVSSILGPTAQQLLDFGYAAASPQGDLGKQALKAVPGYVFVR